MQQRLRQQAVVVVVRHAIRGTHGIAQAPVLKHQARPVECVGAQVCVAPPQAAQRVPVHNSVRMPCVLANDAFRVYRRG